MTPLAQEKHILLSPLNWGLGHATRCIPVINALLAKGVRVTLAAEEHPRALLEAEFPSLDFVNLPGYNITYPSGGNMAVHMLKLMPKILNGIKKEHAAANALVKELGIDGIISDNRFGLHSDLVPTVFITHQVMIKSPYGESLLQKLSRRYINKFTQCWIPDVAGEANLSGDLSHTYPPPERSRFVGPLSRFTHEESDSKYDVIAVISGPEPQRTLFQHIVATEMEISNVNGLLVLGKAGMDQHYIQERLTYQSHLNASDLQAAIAASDIVIARSGYSTIMDLAAMGKKAILIPTPGQTEQEYLADYHMERGHFFSMEQDRFDLEEALEHSKSYKGLHLSAKDADLSDAVDAFLAQL